MPSNRTRINRARTPRIDAETLALFKELELVPLRRRRSAEFDERAVNLHRRLDLSFGYRFMSCSVLSRELTPHCRPGEGVWDDWHKARAMRLRLLAMAGMSEAPAKRAGAN
jgi:hypothetical protein